jgi:hypothetical protein
MESAVGERRKEGVSKGQTAPFTILNDFSKECGKYLGKLYMLASRDSSDLLRGRDNARNGRRASEPRPPEYMKKPV